MKKPVYKWSDGSRVQIDAQPSGERLGKLRAKKGAALTAVDVLDDATSKRSPLHFHFEWDDEEAAHQFRLDQARLLLRSLVKVYITDEGEQAVRKVWVNIHSDELEDNAYEELEYAMQSPILRKRVLGKALRELESFQRKYDDLVELGDVFTAAEKARKKSRESSPKSKDTRPRA